MANFNRDTVLNGEMFTIQFPNDEIYKGIHRTFKVNFKAADENYRQDSWFLMILSGRDNTKDFRYVGMLNPNTGWVSLTKGSGGGAWKENPPAFIAGLGKVLQNTFKGEQWRYADEFTVYGETPCRRCGRPLTVPRSIELGIGPECEKMENYDSESSYTIYG
jgi:hypothetical protein